MPGRAALPDFPWDRLAPFAQTARSHPDGVADLSVGTPVDPTPELVQAALAVASNAPGYPPVAGLPPVAPAARGWLLRALGVELGEEAAVLPTIGSKELVAMLPILLGLAAGDTVVVPTLAYPTYDVGARFAGCDVRVSDDPADVAGARLVWINSPGNPTGAIADPDWMTAMVEAARATGAVLASDECYAEFAWEGRCVSALHPQVSGGSSDGILSLHSLSKRSAMAGYRFGFVVGDEGLLADLLEVRKHLGFMVPAPVQHAAVAALTDDEHVAVQRANYSARRDILRAVLPEAGFRIDDSQAGLYLWATRDEPCWTTVAILADQGILVTPGDFYGPAGEQHVRVALTATDAAIDLAATRLLSAF
jgi:succinyldiaminopimelate transaminase